MVKFTFMILWGRAEYVFLEVWEGWNTDLLKRNKGVIVVMI